MRGSRVKGHFFASESSTSRSFTIRTTYVTFASSGAKPELIARAQMQRDAADLDGFFPVVRPDHDLAVPFATNVRLGGSLMNNCLPLSKL